LQAVRQSWFIITANVSLAEAVADESELSSFRQDHVFRKENHEVAMRS